MMNHDVTRRNFLQTAAGATAVAMLNPRITAAQTDAGNVRPVVIASGNGLPATEHAAKLIRDGTDTLDAVVAGVNIVEADPTDHSVGLGGLPNEDGIVELDSSVMHGPTHNAGAVAALRNIVHPSRVARLVMQRTDHCMLVGEGALRFARAHGFTEQNLLTDDARKIWLKWKETLSQRDDWLEAPADERRGAAIDLDEAFTYGTINCCAVNAAGDLSGVTTTSGLSFKIPGRVGDSPIIGAGLYVDNEVGAAGATGRGEAVILNAGSASVVERMRAGRSPEQACLDVLTRIADRTRDRRLLDDSGKPNFQVTFYAVAKNGQYGSASIWSGGPSRKKFAVYSDGRNRHEESAYLYKSVA